MPKKKAAKPAETTGAVDPDVEEVVAGWHVYAPHSDQDNATIVGTFTSQAAAEECAAGYRRGYVVKAD